MVLYKIIWHWYWLNITAARTQDFKVSYMLTYVTHTQAQNWDYPVLMNQDYQVFGINRFVSRLEFRHQLPVHVKSVRLILSAIKLTQTSGHMF